MEGKMANFDKKLHLPWILSVQDSYNTFCGQIFLPKYEFGQIISPQKITSPQRIHPPLGVDLAVGNIIWEDLIGDKEISCLAWYCYRWSPSLALGWQLGPKWGAIFL